MLAFQAAVNMGVDYIECDIHKSADGICFIHHDPLVGRLRTTVASFAELQQEARSLHYEILTLTELLQLNLRRTRLDFELKEAGSEIVVVETVKHYLSEDQFVITSFEDVSIQAIKRAYPSIQCGLLLGIWRPRHRVMTWLRALFPFGRARSVGADFVAPHWSLLRFWFLTRAQVAGFPVWVWTVNDQLHLRELLSDERVQSVITDRPDIAMAVRDSLYPDNERG